MRTITFILWVWRHLCRFVTNVFLLLYKESESQMYIWVSFLRVLSFSLAYTCKSTAKTSRHVYSVLLCDSQEKEELHAKPGKWSALCSFCYSGYLKAPFQCTRSICLQKHLSESVVHIAAALFCLSILMDYCNWTVFAILTSKNKKNCFKKHLACSRIWQVGRSLCIRERTVHMSWSSTAGRGDIESLPEGACTEAKEFGEESQASNGVTFGGSLCSGSSSKHLVWKCMLFREVEAFSTNYLF